MKRILSRIFAMSLITLMFFIYNFLDSKTGFSASSPTLIDNGHNSLMLKQRIIRTIVLCLHTENVNKLMLQITQLTEHFNGYVVSSRYAQGNQENKDRVAELSIRIPAGNLENILNKLKLLA